VDALAPGGDEGRGTLRKAMGSREQALIHGYPNGETHPAMGIPIWIHRVGRRTRGTETSQYPEEKTSTEIPSVVASESGTGQWLFLSEQNGLESPARVGDSPVCEEDENDPW
jgi:hypothetical protein